MEDLDMRTPSDFFNAYNNLIAECSAAVAEIVQRNGGKVSLNYTEGNEYGTNLILNAPNEYGDDNITFVEVMNGLGNALVLTDEDGNTYDLADLYNESILYIYDAVVSAAGKKD